MPIGLMVMQWDDRDGAVVVAEHPNKYDLDFKTLMQIYSAHEYTGEAGTVSLTTNQLNLLSYYAGPKKALYFILLLKLDEDSESYEDGLVSNSQIIIQNYDDDSYLKILPSLFQKIALYPSFSDEQRLINLYSSKIKRMMIDRLREEGILVKSEIDVWLKDKYAEGFIDLESELKGLIKSSIIKGSSVKGMPSDVIFLINDLLMNRIPPKDLILDPVEKGLPKDLKDTYIQECRNYFLNYKPSEDDNIHVLEVLSIPSVYEVLRLLRMAIVTYEDLEKLKKKGVDDPKDVIAKLKEIEMVHSFKDKRDVEYHALINDFYIKSIFPKYMLNVIKSAYKQKIKANITIVEYLKILDDTYQESRGKSKT